MDKKPLYLITFLLVLIILITTIAIIQNSKKPVIQLQPIFIEDEPIKIYEFNESTKFESLRFTDSRISYSISNECSKSRINNAVEAFGILEDKTVLSFYEVNDNPQIKVSCDKSEEKSNEIVGEGGPTFIINTGKYDVILNGTVKLYEDDNCRTPIIATHEILHVIGFKHIDDKNSIMYKISNCDQELTQDIIDEISRKYQTPSLPDLELRRATVEKDGRYINLEVSVFNIGLAETQNTNLRILEDGKEIKTYNLDNLEVGSGKIIKVKNLLVPKSITGLTFIIDENNDIPEINETNNREEIVF